MKRLTKYFVFWGLTIISFKAYCFDVQEKLREDTIVWLNERKIAVDSVDLKDDGVIVNKTLLTIDGILLKPGAQIQVIDAKIRSIVTKSAVKLGPYLATGLIEYFQNKPDQFTIVEDVKVGDLFIPKNSSITIDSKSYAPRIITFGRASVFQGKKVRNGQRIFYDEQKKIWKESAPAGNKE